MNYTCVKNVKSHNGKQYRLGQEITIIEFNNLSFSERENFIRVDRKVEQVGIGNDLNNEL
jgi:hypothetical protein